MTCLLLVLSLNLLLDRQNRSNNLTQTDKAHTALPVYAFLSAMTLSGKEEIVVFRLALKCACPEPCRRLWFMGSGSTLGLDRTLPSGTAWHNQEIQGFDGLILSYKI